MVMFFLLDDVRRGTFWTVGQISSATGAQFLNTEKGIPRSTFLSWLGVGLSSTLFFSLLYGFGNKYNYQLVHQKIKLKNLPDAFKGFKIIHISDIHSGSLKEKEAVLKGIQLINQQEADLVLFTGDLVNDRATEMRDWKDVFSQIKAKNGVYSTLGNHDYGDYVQWDSVEAKQQNLRDLANVHEQMGWRLLMNENVAIEKDNATIRLVGIENWGAKARFPKYGKMDLAMQNVDPTETIILLSHDPSHWEAQVQKQYPQVDLMLSGHTHGMQFGLENPYFKWSPVQWVYKQWAGVYQQNDQLCVGMIFLPRNDYGAQEACRTIVEHELLSNNFYIFGWRQVPVKAKVLGIKANDTRPEIEQILFSPIKKTGSEELEKNIYIVRKKN